jgi:hypothetical protein
MYVSSVPAGQAVTVDGQARGSTPVTLTLPPGEHRVRIGTAVERTFALREGSNPAFCWDVAASAVCRR